jgi:hypothetical protein
MSLNDIVGRVIDVCKKDGRIDTHSAIEAGLPLVLQDDDVRDRLIRDALGRAILAASTRISRVSDQTKQPSFFGDRLRRAYATNLDGRTIKETDSLTRLEFERLISIREKQVMDDMAHLNVLREAKRQLSPIWDVHPDYTYGQAELAFLATETETAA